MKNLLEIAIVVATAIVLLGAALSLWMLINLL